MSQISGWRAKQRYFRRSVNDVVLKTQLENEELYEQLRVEVDKGKASTASPENNIDPVSDLLVHPPKRWKTGPAAAISPLLSPTSSRTFLWKVSTCEQ